MKGNDVYKDKEKRKEASKERMRRHREKVKGVTEVGCNKQGVTNQESVIPEQNVGVIPKVEQGWAPIEATVLYSQERWARLYEKGYRMPTSNAYDGQMNLEGHVPLAARLGYARKVVGAGPTYQFAVPVPGDPAYQVEAA